MPYKKQLLLISTIFFFTACKKEVKTTFLDINLTTENNKIVEVNIPEAIGNKAIVGKINSEIQKAVITALHIGDPNRVTSKSIEESIALFNQEYNNFKTEFPENLQQWEAQIDGEIMFQSPKIMSIAITSYSNTGGAHGTLNISFLNFEIETGELIDNDKLINNLKPFKNLAKTYFDEAIKEKDLVIDTETFELPANIAYSDDGLILLYNIYEIAPYSDGIIEFAIPFDEAKPYLVFNSL
ncbi:DUF3298 and DUF4163 domain-containing protein [Flaviramulus sp. BrNp1-15]|uniref:DUF3298 and DUF4163 domain-containing protein n=1 Tax=Flaviramulus sp. BrNp1-15 TaxID=2916754 RepID=UPI001EE9258D|nr:DUF3298 and DUF4163 domain-containing protein [Flaviramulus sp. BrNp1-15]ULC59885.1 DUF3298 and DUF4163 domain-containing protein [Flaviramulus sp. BrNp1-15]